MVSGKNIRLNRITASGRMICVPMDHGVSNGPLRGLDTMDETIRLVEKGGATAILVHKGIIRTMGSPTQMGLIMHASGSTSLGLAPNRKMLVSSVEEAVRLGADAVSVHVNVGCKEEPEMLQDLGMIADSCDEWNMPLVAMMYPRGENIKNPSDPATLAHAARIGSELGADIVKTPYSGDYESFRTVVKGCRVPVVIAGGPKSDTDRDVLEMAHGAVKAGAIGVTFGRNIFQHQTPDLIVKALSMIVMNESSVEDALKVL
ncbi:MAG: class I fructose-bisphosphate aldolase family protein [Thaumarchaeota archaeon]|nr:class I fructose-bisphosphate aldolase family protein [Nitrososphaerota archaeon]